MKLKKVIVIGIFYIFLISFITHNMYEWFPSIITFMFFPINESIWEHMKMIFSSYLIWGIIEYFILVKNNLYSRNTLFGIVTSSLFNIVLFLLVYVPIYSVYGHNLLVTLLIYLLTIVLSMYLNYLILNDNIHYRKLNTLSLVLIPIIWGVFIYLSYNPLPYDLLFSVH